jgi:hypothetical protein
MLTVVRVKLSRSQVCAANRASEIVAGVGWAVLTTTTQQHYSQETHCLDTISFLYLAYTWDFQYSLNSLFVGTKIGARHRVTTTELPSPLQTPLLGHSF